MNGTSSRWKHPVIQIRTHRREGTKSRGRERSARVNVQCEWGQSLKTESVRSCPRRSPTLSTPQRKRPPFRPRGRPCSHPTASAHATASSPPSEPGPTAGRSSLKSPRGMMLPMPASTDIPPRTPSRPSLRTFCLSGEHPPSAIPPVPHLLNRRYQASVLPPEPSPNLAFHPNFSDPAQEDHSFLFALRPQLLKWARDR